MKKNKKLKKKKEKFTPESSFLIRPPKPGSKLLALISSIFIPEEWLLHRMVSQYESGSLSYDCM